MFHWICPECGGEIPPTVRECPICDPSAAPVELAPAAGVKRVAEQVSGAVLTVADPTVAVVNGKPAVGKTRLRITGPPVVPGAADKAIDVAPAAESAPPAVEDSGAEDSKVEVEGSQVSAGESRAKVEGWDAGEHSNVKADDSHAAASVDPADSPVAMDGAVVAEDVEHADAGAAGIGPVSEPTEDRTGPVGASQECARTTDPGAAGIEPISGPTEGRTDPVRASEPPVSESLSQDIEATKSAEAESIVQIAAPEIAVPETAAPEIEAMEVAVGRLRTLGEQSEVMEETAAITEAAATMPVEGEASEPEVEPESLSASLAVSEVKQRDESERRGAAPLEPGDLLELAAVVGMREADEPEESWEGTPTGTESVRELPVKTSAEVQPEAPSSVTPAQDSQQQIEERHTDIPPFSPAIDLQRTIATLRALASQPGPNQFALLAPAPKPIEPEHAASPLSPVLDLEPASPVANGLGLEPVYSIEPQGEASFVAAEPAVETAPEGEIPGHMESAQQALGADDRLAARPAAAEPDVSELAEPVQSLVEDPRVPAADDASDGERLQEEPVEQPSLQSALEPIEAGRELVAAIPSAEQSVAAEEAADPHVSAVIEPPLPSTDAMATSVEAAVIGDGANTPPPTVGDTETLTSAGESEGAAARIEERVADAQVAGSVESDARVTSPADETKATAAREIPASEITVPEAVAEPEQSAAEMPSGGKSAGIGELEASPDEDAETAPVEEAASPGNPAVEGVPLGPGLSHERSSESAERASQQDVDPHAADEPVPPAAEPEERGLVTSGPQETSHLAPEEPVVGEPASIEAKPEEEPVTPEAADEFAPATNQETSVASASAEESANVVPISLISGQTPEAGDKIEAEPAVPEISALGPSLPLAPLREYRPATPSGMRPAPPESKILKPNASPTMTLPGPLLPPKLLTFQEGKIASGDGGKGHSKKSAIPGWVVSGVVAIVLLGAGAVAVLPSLPHPNTEGKATSTETPTPAAQDTSYPLTKAVEVTGFRFVVDFNKKSEIHYLVVNHSSANLTGVNIFVTLQSGGAKAGQPPVCRFSFLAPDLGPFESKEMISSIEKLNRSVSLPDWQDLRADVQVAP